MLQENHRKLRLRDYCGWDFYDLARKKMKKLLSSLLPENVLLISQCSATFF